MNLSVRVRELYWGLWRRPGRGSPPVLMFDFDGVIADSLEIYLEAFLEACGEIGAKHLQSREAFLSLMDGNFAVQLMRHGFPLRKLRALAAIYEPRIRDIFKSVRPFPEMPDIMRALAERYRVYIITSNRTDFVLQFLKEYGIQGIRGVIGSDVDTSKVRKILRVRRMEPSHVPWYIGDTLGDMLEGKRAGACTAAVTWGWHAEGRLLKGQPDAVFRSPGEMPKFRW